MLVFVVAASTANVLARELTYRQNPYWIAFWRSIVSVPGLALLLKLTGRKILLQRVDRWRFVVLALLAIPGNQLLYITGINTSLASHAALLYGTTPAWVLLIAVGLGMERLRGWKVTGIILSISGVVIVLLGGGMVMGSGTLRGDIFLLLAVLTWSLYTVLGKPLVERYGALEVTFLVIAFGALMYFPIGLPIAVMADYSTISLNDWAIVLYLGFVTSGLVYYLWFWLVTYLRPTQVAIVMCGQPPITFAMASVFQGEQLTSGLGLGSLMILGGIVLTVVMGGQKRSLDRAVPLRPPETGR